MIDELHSSYIQRDQMEGESGVSRRIIHEHSAWDFERDDMEGESAVTLSIIEELHSSYIQEDQMERDSDVT